MADRELFRRMAQLNRESRTNGNGVERSPSTVFVTKDDFEDLAQTMKNAIDTLQKLTGSSKAPPLKPANVFHTGVDRLKQLSDVSDVNPTNNQVLTYKSASNKWEASAGGSTLSVTSSVATTINPSTDDDVILSDATAGNVTVNLPTAVGNSGKVFHIKKIDSGSNTVTVDGATTETIDGATTYVLTVENEAIKIVSDNSNWHIL